MSFALLQANRKTKRMYDSEYDRCTIVSIYPLALDEIKPTIEPGRFVIPAGSRKFPQTLVVTGSSWWRDFNPQEPLLEVPQPSPIVAQSIVNDYSRGILGYDAGTAEPGLFWLPQTVKVDELEKKYKEQMDSAEKKQNKWYETLIRMADNLWARTNGNPLAIPDLCRLACNELSQSRPWVSDFAKITMDKCPACGTLVNLEYPVCANCKTVINEEKARALKLVFAK